MLNLTPPARFLGRGHSPVSRRCPLPLRWARTGHPTLVSPPPVRPDWRGFCSPPALPPRRGGLPVRTAGYSKDEKQHVGTDPLMQYPRPVTQAGGLFSSQDSRRTRYDVAVPFTVLLSCPRPCACASSAPRAATGAFFLTRGTPAGPLKPCIERRGKTQKGSRGTDGRARNRRFQPPRPGKTENPRSSNRGFSSVRLHIHTATYNVCYGR